MAPARVFGAFAGRALMAAAAKAGASATAKKAASGGAATATKAAKKAPSRPSRPRNNVGIQKVVPVSSELGSFLGASEVSRTHAVKRVWEYIKLQNLQNPSNKKEIFCDDKLKTIFDGKDKVGFTEIARLLATHFVKSG